MKVTPAGSRYYAGLWDLPAPLNASSPAYQIRSVRTRARGSGSCSALHPPLNRGDGFTSIRRLGVRAVGGSGHAAWLSCAALRKLPGAL